MPKGLFYFHGDKNWPKTEKKFIIDSLLADELIFGHPLGAFDFAFSHPKLANELVKAECYEQSIEAMLDTLFDSIFDMVVDRTGMPNIDLASLYILEAGYLLERKSPLYKKLSKELKLPSNPLSPGVPNLILVKIKEMISTDRCKIQAFEPPFKLEELYGALEQLDKRMIVVEHVIGKFDNWQEYMKKHFLKPSKERLMYSATQSLARTFLYAKNSLNVIPSEAKIYQRGYKAISSELIKNLRKADIEVIKIIMKEKRVNKLINYLFQRQEHLHSLVGFPIANPLDMIHRKVSTDELDDVILKVRKKGKVPKIRSAIYKIYENVEKGNLEKAADVKKKIEDMNPKLELNKDLTDAFRQFDKPIIDELEKKLEQELNDLNWLKRPKAFFTRVGDLMLVIGFVSFLTPLIGLPIALSGAQASLIRALEFISRTASAEVLGLRTTAWLLKEKLASKVGLDFYSIFHDWPSKHRY